ncbi:MAG: hypothetical protein S4CHLAM102_05980 [Chlamydiia bacterium]|nr:hypothetical protein [Chlamydiia bacterium]
MIKSSDEEKNILLLTSTGGSGHIQAALAKKSQMALRYPNATLFEQDIMTDWIGKHFGQFCVNKWDNAQRLGNVFELEMFIRLLPLFEWGYFLPIFVRALWYILKHDIDFIIDTQPMGTSAITKALRIASIIRKKPIRLEKVITELPTEQVTHFFQPIKKLSTRYQNVVNIISPPPLAYSVDGEKAFWKRYCGISRDSISYNNLPLRPAFLQYLNKEREHEPVTLDLQFQHPSEIHAIHNTMKKGCVEVTRRKGKLTMTIQPEDHVTMMMLGGNPPEKALLQYVQSFINMTREQTQEDEKYILFLFCSSVKAPSNDLQDMVHEIVRNDLDFPKNLSVVPLTYQTDSVVAPLLFRSDATITKSGGMTAMELLYVGRGTIFIHEEDPPKNRFGFLPFRKPLDGMPTWEKGNARYLQEKKGAILITPDTFKLHADELLSKEKNNIPEPVHF